MHSRVSPAGWLIVCGAVLGATTAQAQLLNDRLVPPQQVAQPPVPMVSQPVERGVFGVDKSRAPQWALPVGSFPGTPALLASEQRPANWRRAPLDVPALMTETDPARPQFPLLSVAPRAYAPAPNPAQPPILARFPLPAELPVMATEDPGAVAALSVLTAAVPLATPGPAPLLRLSIPDPFEQIRTIRLAVTPADADAPVKAQDRPVPVKLPNVELK